MWEGGEQQLLFHFGKKAVRLCFDFFLLPLLLTCVVGSRNYKASEARNQCQRIYSNSVQLSLANPATLQGATRIPYVNTRSQPTEQGLTAPHLFPRLESLVLGRHKEQGRGGTCRLNNCMAPSAGIISSSGNYLLLTNKLLYAVSVIQQESVVGRKSL